MSFGFEDNGVVLGAAQTKPNTKFFAQPSLLDVSAIQLSVPQSVELSVAFGHQFENLA